MHEISILKTAKSDLAYISIQFGLKNNFLNIFWSWTSLVNPRSTILLHNALIKQNKTKQNKTKQTLFFFLLLLKLA